MDLRWHRRDHAQVLLGIVDKHFCGMVPTSGKESKQQADLMLNNNGFEGWDPDTLKPYAKKLVEKGGGASRE